MRCDRKEKKTRIFKYCVDKRQTALLRYRLSQGFSIFFFEGVPLNKIRQLHSTTNFGNFFFSNKRKADPGQTS